MAQQDAALLEAVVARARDAADPAEAGDVERFVRGYYAHVAPDDLADRSAEDLCGAAVAHWNLARVRRPGETKIHVYTPNVEEHGWESPHSVVETGIDDMPFLVDSISIEVSRHGRAVHLVIRPIMCIERDDEGRLLAVGADNGTAESLIHVELDVDQRLGGAVVCADREQAPLVVALDAHDRADDEVDRTPVPADLDRDRVDEERHVVDDSLDDAVRRLPAVLLDVRRVDVDLRLARTAYAREVPVRDRGAAEVLGAAVGEVVGGHVRVVAADEALDVARLGGVGGVAGARDDRLEESGVLLGHRTSEAVAAATFSW